MTNNHGAELKQAVADAELGLSYVWVFRQETGEEGFVHGMSLNDAIIRHPEWSYSYGELVRDAAYYKWLDACNEYDFWFKTKDMTEEEYEDYLDNLNDYDYDYYNDY